MQVEVLNSNNLTLVKKQPWILDIAAHGYQEKQVNSNSNKRHDTKLHDPRNYTSLAFEKLNGEGEKVSALKIDNILNSIHIKH